MGASISVYWPGATEEEQGDHSGFSQDDHAYACWQAEIQSRCWTKRGITTYQLEALLSIYPIGTDENDVRWTTPSQLREAAIQLKTMLLAREPFALKLAQLYTKGPGIEEPHIELATDLEDLSWIAEYARKRGADKVTLLVNW